MFSGISTNTRLVYNTAVNSFTSFRKLYSLPLKWPIPQNHLIWFITYCFEKAYSPRTITTYISGLAFYHKINEWYNITDVFIVRKILEGCRRKRSCTDNRAPISLLMLEEICRILPTVTFSEFETGLFKALFTLAYFGLFRVSELVFTQTTNRAVQINDVKIGRDNTSCSICLHVFKNNQLGQPVMLRIPCEENKLICPVCNLKAYIAQRPNVKGQLFSHANSGPVTRYQFSAVLKKCIRNSSFKCQEVKTHSF